MVHPHRQCTLHVVRDIGAWMLIKNLTERHFHTLLGVEEDRRIILVAIRSQRDGDGVILTLYGILYNGTEGDG